MNTTHNPAPWSLAPGSSSKEAAQIRSADNKVVAVIPHPSAHGDVAVADFYQRRANALLIKAAPILLEALRDAVSTQPADSPIKWVLNARAVITQATGETNA